MAKKEQVEILKKKLKTYLKDEKGGKKNYKETAEDVNEPEKSTFKGMANDEGRHYQNLQKMKQVAAVKRKMNNG